MMLVLVAEDEIFVQMVMVAELRAAGHEVLTAANGGIALRMIEERDDIQVLITDHRMPVMTGADLIRRVRAEHSGVRTVMVSAQEGAEELAKEAGADRFCAKPAFCLSTVIEELSQAA